MSKFTKQMGVLLAFGLLAALTGATGVGPAASQDPGGPEAAANTMTVVSSTEGVVEIEVDPRERSTPASRPAYAGTGSGEVGGAPPPPTGATEDPVNGGAESIIGSDDRVLISATEQYPNRAIGHLSITQRGLVWACTGFLIDRNTVLTSGHCVHEGFGGNFSTNVVFSPGRGRNGNPANFPYGSCGATSLVTVAEWSTNGSEYADYGFVQLDCEIGVTTGWLGYFAVKGQKALKNRNAVIRGYPGTPPEGLNGTLWHSRGKIKASQKKMVFYAMDTSGGQSGSPVYQPNRPACGGPCAMAIHSYGNAHGGGPHQAYNHGPRITLPRFNLIASVADSNNAP